MAIRIKLKKSALRKFGIIIPAAVAVVVLLLIFVPRGAKPADENPDEEVAEITGETSVAVDTADFSGAIDHPPLTRAERRALRRAEKAMAREMARSEKELARIEKEREKAGKERLKEEEKLPKVPKTMYGIEYECYELERGTVGNGQTLSHILGKYGVGTAMVDKIDRNCRPVYNMRSIRAGQPYVALLGRSGDRDSLCHFIYEKNATDYVVVSLSGDSVIVRSDCKEVTLKRRKETAVIKSSLWNAMAEDDMPAALPASLEDIYGWSVDFFGLQKNDSLTVIFDEKHIDTLRVGIGNIWGAEFTHMGKTYYAIPFIQDGHLSYWDENGKSLRKQLLKAPLKFSRISSKFSNSRLHPVLKIYRPHHGVDYAAPKGTPVVAIADGTVTFKGWDKGGGGNTLKIKHANNLASAYLHLNGFASGIKVGGRVSQGQLIGYVGSTGTSTGPHLDFRLYKGGTAIDPLKAPSDPVEPITAANKAAFEAIRDKVMAELKGEVPESEKLKSLAAQGEHLGEP